MFWALLIAAAQPAAVADPVVIALVAGEGERKCLPDKSLCLDVPGGSDGGLVLTAPNAGESEDLALPYSRDGQTLNLWPYLIAVPSPDAMASDSRQYLMGIVVSTSAMYSGGGGNGSRLHLLRLDTTPSNTQLGDEVLDVVWDSSLMIRACFSEQEMKDRREACHDDYNFTGALLAGPVEVGELPVLTYRAVATAFPRTARRSSDNSKLRLKAADLVHAKDSACSYERTLRYNPATSRYEMDRPAPDCSDYTTP
ncbi:hypothetical protein [Sphingopyxis witflariensis]|uniref:Uncharacterized protein n=1 Tax=Sphingopyxis witflariensis TaxID=173675 RepID=A0A246JIH3_9SPHN|nr:hypothetical protein [Sphingopyxis witflariensis]OWQ92401.1 hypothetical protein CDQ91_18260 [Sphingopyxis witflariensis]